MLGGGDDLDVAWLHKSGTNKDMVGALDCVDQSQLVLVALGMAKVLQQWHLVLDDLK